MSVYLGSFFFLRLSMNDSVSVWFGFLGPNTGFQTTGAASQDLSVWRLGSDSWSVPSIYLSISFPEPSRLVTSACLTSISALPDFQLLELFCPELRQWRLPCARFSVISCKALLQASISLCECFSIFSFKNLFEIFSSSVLFVILN